MSRPPLLVACCLALALPSAASPSTQARKAIEEISAQWMAALAKGDAAALAAFYAEDALLMPPNAPTVKGRPAIQEAFAGMIQSGVKGAELKTDEVQVHGDVAVETGTFSVNFQPPGKDVIKGADEGKFLVIWKKSGGKWRYYRDIWNSSRAPPPPAAAPADASAATPAPAKDAPAKEAAPAEGK